jgi:hypothetical protein
MEAEKGQSAIDAAIRNADHRLAFLQVGNISFKLSRNIANPN